MSVKGKKENRLTTRKNKALMLDALRRSLGVVSVAARSINITGPTHYNWLNDDPEYKRNVQEINDFLLDFGENALLKLMQEGNPQAIIFFNKTKNAKRGYQENKHITTDVTLREDSAKKMQEVYYEIVNESRGDTKKDTKKQEH